jgi:hypothetical protein
MIALGGCFLVIGIILAAYWLLFMSWGHNYASQTIRSPESITFLLAWAFGAVGLALLVAGWARRRRANAAGRANGSSRDVEG